MQAPLPWIEVCKNAPYFATESGNSWTPIGQNDAITWPELRGLYKRRNVAKVEAYLRTLSEHGITCLRLMLEYSQKSHRDFERPAGCFRPEMVQLWDDLFSLCDKNRLRILLTPFDTYWMWVKWKHHPYNEKNSGPCPDRASLLLSRGAREAMKRRLRFVCERWSCSGALFGWDLWNEIHPSYAENSADCFDSFIAELSDCVRSREQELYGRSHPQTVSVFGPHMVLDQRIPNSVFRHPSLDFASTHFYEEGTIDDPKDTVAPAISTGKLMREALAEVHDSRPFMDSEHGPIHTYKDHHKTLPEPFDDEYFRHIQWAHFCAGGAGGGMRWPNRNPHSLTKGMRNAQDSLARFAPLIDWVGFRRRNWNDEVNVCPPEVKAVACGDGRQAVVWLIRTDRIRRDGMLRRDVKPVPVTLSLPLLEPGTYRITGWDTREGQVLAEYSVTLCASGTHIGPVPVAADLALAVRRHS
ncbi:MAG: hypothetical protein JO062_03185 [Bryobacterales bacterium]|nr:hypothetical protein [Bryobacterales bacterium]